MDGDPLRIGDFRIIRRIGAGGMGVVYLAEQANTGLQVALKVIGRSLTEAAIKDRFRREATAIAALNHPGIASIHFVGQDNQICYIAMQYIDGVSLRLVIDRMRIADSANVTIDHCIHKEDENEPATERFDIPALAETEVLEQKPLTHNPFRSPRATSGARNTEHIRRCVEIARDVAGSLEHAHSRGVVHRDVKPDNIMLESRGKAWLIDFGLAQIQHELKLTQTGALLGTPLYMSPEQVTGRVSVDHRTDIYSLGLVLYELLALVPPIKGDNRETVLRSIVTKALLPLRELNSSVPIKLESVVHKATDKDPDRRYKTALEFQEDLDAVLDGRPVTAKPYRHKLDLSEIRATRPPFLSLVALSLGSWVPLLLTCMIFCLWLGYGSTITAEDPSAHLAATGSLFAGLIVLVGFYLFTSFAVLEGYRGSFSAAAVGLVLPWVLIGCAFGVIVVLSDGSGSAVTRDRPFLFLQAASFVLIVITMCLGWIPLLLTPVGLIALGLSSSWFKRAREIRIAAKSHLNFDQE